LYFDLGNFGSRGGVIRFFFLAHNIDFEESMVATDESVWKTKKIELQAGDNPAGHLPVVYLGNKILTEHHSIVRYFARIAGCYGKDADADFAHDSIAEVTKEWRSDWSEAMREKSSKKSYVKTQSFYLSVVETLLSRHQKYFPKDSIGIADVVLFGQVRDDMLLGAKLHRADYPHLALIYDKVGSNPKIAAWTAAHGGY